MRFQWPVSFNQAEQANKRPNRLREIGGTGQVLYGGKLLETDYNVDLQAPNSYDIYDRMRMSDGTVSGLLRAIKLPLLNVDWRVKPASDDEADAEIAAWLDFKLHSMTTSYQNTLVQILLYLVYGSMPFETVWQLDAQNLVSLRKLAPRMPKSVTEWKVDSAGGFSGIKQGFFSGEGEWKEVNINAEKMVLFVNDLEGSNFRGTSLLRSAYKHWFYKDKMYVIDAIAKERRAIGIDVGTLQEAGADDETALQGALASLHAHEKQYFIEQEDRYKYRIEGLQGRPLPVLDSIEHHDKMILRSVLAEFLSLGDGGGGSFALSRDKSSFLTLALNSILKTIADTLNQHLIKKWVSYNWNVDKYPELTYSRVENRDLEGLSNAIQRLQQSGFIQPTPFDEEAMRDALELPSVNRPKTEDAANIPLNGAQLNAITILFQRVGENLISMEQARGILKATFPFLTQEQINAMTGA